jgi:hypothetical protein
MKEQRCWISRENLLKNVKQATSSRSLGHAVFLLSIFSAYRHISKRKNPSLLTRATEEKTLLTY